MKKIILASLVLAGTLVADTNKEMKKYEISPVIGKVFTKDDVQLKDHGVGGIFVGRQLDQKYYLNQLELGLLFGNADYEKNLNPTGSSDITRFLVSGIKDYKITQRFGLFGAIGIGYEKLKNELHDDKSDLLLNYGVGLKYKLTDYVSLRSDLRHLIKKDGDKNILLSVGLAIPFGGEQKASIKHSKITKETNKISAKKEEVKKEVVTKTAQIEEKVVKLQKKIEKNMYVKPTNMVVFFGFDSDVVKPNYAGELKRFVDNLDDTKDTKIELVGYTDSLGDVSYNKALAQRRINSVINKLEEYGVSKEDIEAKYLGEEFDAIKNETAITRKNNRKVEISIK